MSARDELSLEQQNELLRERLNQMSEELEAAEAKRDYWQSRAEVWQQVWREAIRELSSL